MKCLSEIPIYFPTSSGSIYKVDSKTHQLNTLSGSPFAIINNENFHEGQPFHLPDNDDLGMLFENQNLYAQRSSAAAQQMLNPVDREKPFRFVLDISHVYGSQFPFQHSQSDSCTLAYSTRLIINWWNVVKVKSSGAIESNYDAIFMTGTVNGVGIVNSVEAMDEKAKGIIEFIRNQQLSEVLFVFGSNELPRSNGPFAELLNMPENTSLDVRDLHKVCEHLFGIKNYFDANWNPMKGLLHFDYQDKEAYCGRNEYESEVAHRCFNEKGVGIIYAPSGRGKSSFLSAGVAPAYEKLVRQQDSEQSFQFLRTTPSKSRMRDIPPKKETSDWIPRRIAETLNKLKNPAGLLNEVIEFIHNIYQTKDVTAVCLIFVDQSEELFSNEGLTSREHREYVEDIQRLSNCTEHLKLVFAIRFEYLINLEDLFRQYRGLQIWKESFEPYELDDWKNAISHLVKLSGLRFECSDGRYSKDLINVIEENVEANPKESGPILSLLLQRLYNHCKDTQKVSYDDYIHVTGATKLKNKSGKFILKGGLEGIINRYANELVNDFNNIYTGESLNIWLDKLFFRMIYVPEIYPNSTGFSSRYFEVENEAAAPLKHLVEVLYNGRLITRGANLRLYRIAHESLFQWEKVTSWFVNKGGFSRWKQGAEREAVLWDQKNRRKDMLLTDGFKLDEAKKWTSEFPEDLIDIESRSSEEDTLGHQRKHGDIESYKVPVKTFVFESIRVRTLEKRVKYASIAGFTMLLLILTVFAGINSIEANNQALLAQEERDKITNIMSEVSKNITFMNLDLRDALNNYVPIQIRLEVIKQVEEITNAFEQYTTDEDARLLLARAGNLFEKANAFMESASEDSSKALPLLEESLFLFERLAELKPTVRNRGNVTVPMDALGNYWLRLGDEKKAKDYYLRSLRITEELVNSNPERDNLRGNLSISYEKMGDVSSTFGDIETGLRYYQQSMELDAYLARKNPDDLTYKHYLSISNNKIGDVYMELEDYTNASAKYQVAYKIRLRLVELEPENKGFQRDLSESMEKLAEIHLVNGAGEQAIQLFAQAKKLIKELHTSDENNNVFLHDLTVATYNYGRGYAATARHDLAVEQFNGAVALGESLLSNDQVDNIELRKDIMLSYWRLGISYGQLDNVAQANESFKQAVSSSFAIIEDDPLTTNHLRNLSSLYEDIASFYSGIDEQELFNQYIAKAIETLQRIELLQPLWDKDKKKVQELQNRIN